MNGLALNRAREQLFAQMNTRAGELEQMGAKLSHELKLIALFVMAVIRSAQAQTAGEHQHSMMMASSAPLGLSMARNGSGTAWQPDSTPMPGIHWQPGAGWEVMLHWNLLVGFDAQTTPRGGHQWTSMNWVMGMAQHDLAGGQIIGRVMLSAEPFSTGGKRGYPLLLQTGEAVDGEALHDRQHPHDLFMEVAAAYALPLNDWLAAQIYLAAAGEPALGPVGFPHRYSALSNPFAVLGHHWQDSTHIAFGVLTAGLYTRQWKFEGSWFNGKEPDQNRYDFDFGSFDSSSARLSFNPTEDWSFQASYGYLPTPEEHTPRVGVDRLAARRLSSDSNWASTAVFGNNWYSKGRPPTLSALVESSLELASNILFGRIEFIQRSGEDLGLDHEPGVAPGIARRVFSSGVLDLGYLRRIGALGPLSLGIGAVGSVYDLDSGLKLFYGGEQYPVAGMLFLRLWPADNHRSGHHSSMPHTM